MNNDKNQLSRRRLMFQAIAGGVAVSLPSAGWAERKSNAQGAGEGMFKIRVQDRKYDLHRPKGCTVLTIEVLGWPGNEFGLWLPETVYVAGEVAWGNWWDDAHQEFERNSRGVWITQRDFDQFSVISTLTPDPANSCLWYRHTFQNKGSETLYELNTQTCFHLVNAPQFISLQGSRIWANLDGQWTSTEKVERDQSPDPRRVWFLKQGLRKERTVVPLKGFPSATMPEAAHHPLLLAENFQGNGTVGIAARNFDRLFNNNDVILRCLHSESAAIPSLEPGQLAHQDSVIMFYKGDHRATVNQYAKRIEPNWPARD